MTPEGQGSLDRACSRMLPIWAQVLRWLKRICLFLKVHSDDSSRSGMITCSAFLRVLRLHLHPSKEQCYQLVMSAMSKDRGVTHRPPPSACRWPGISILWPLLNKLGTEKKKVGLIDRVPIFPELKVIKVLNQQTLKIYICTYIKDAWDTKQNSRIYKIKYTHNTSK